MTETKQEPKPAPTPQDDERKKAADEANKKYDELIKAYEEEKKQQEAPDSQVVKDQERARILNQIYNEKYQPTVRKTPAQENAEKAEKEAHEKASPPHTSPPPPPQQEPKHK